MELNGRRSRHQHAREATRRAILDAALSLFVDNGFAEVSIRNIAVKVDYSPAAIYSYFPSKDDIFLALAEEGFRLLAATHLAMPATDSPLDDLAATGWQLHAFSKEHPQYFALMFLDHRAPRFGRDSDRFAFMADIKDAVTGRVQRCIDAGLLPATLHPFIALRLLTVPGVGVAALRLSDRLAPGEDADGLVHDAISTTLAGLRASVS